MDGDGVLPEAVGSKQSSSKAVAAKNVASGGLGGGETGQLTGGITAGEYRVGGGSTAPSPRTARDLC